MRRLFLILFSSLLFLSACQSDRKPVSLLADGQVYTLNGSGQKPQSLLDEAGVSLGGNDRLLYLGLPVDPGQPLPAASAYTLQVRRAVTVTLVTPQGTRSLESAAFTVGQALSESGIPLLAADRLDPPADTPLYAGLTVTYTPARPLTIQANGQTVLARSAAPAVGQALAEAGLPLEGLDYARPGESEPLPQDGQIRVVHVHETVLLDQKTIAYESEYQPSADLGLDQQEILQPGEPGLAVSRVRIRYEDGQEVSRQTEDESVIRPPKTQIVKTGTKVVLETVNVDGQSLEVWRVLDMYATVYSPCNSGTSGCSYGTASGLRAGKGVVAVDPAMFSYLQGQRVYIPGYGYAVIGDVGGGYIIENTTGISRYRWIDLGFDDNNIMDMTGWVKVYFLAPAPASIPPILQ